MAPSGITIQSLCVQNTKQTLLHNITLIIPPGQMLAVIGGAAAGKSLLLKSLTNAPPEDLHVQMQMLPADLRTGFVPTEDRLIGELTVRETLRYSAQLRCPDEPTTLREERIQQLIDDFGLSEVSDNQIGTVLKRGLSGGQKRRVSVLVECAAQPDLLLLDEPTSGLDSNTALSVCKSMASIAAKRRSVVIASLQQPNTRLLQQFGQVLVLDRGYVVYVGSVDKLQQFFTNIGYPLPDEGAISDHVAALLGSNKQAVAQATKLQQQLLHQDQNHDNAAIRYTTTASTTASSYQLKRFVVLTHRFGVVGVRSLPLYWLQLILVSGFGFLIGAVFWQLPFVAGSRINNLPNGLTWLVYVASYIQVFRVFYQADMRERFRHEHDVNCSYDVFSWSFADFIVTSIGVVLAFIPGLLIALFMMGVPFTSIGYSVLVLWTTAMTSEALLTIVVQLVNSVPYAVLVSQGVLVLSSVFAGGAFISFDRVDNSFWVWLQDISLYNYASRAIEIFTFQRLSYSCYSASSITNECQMATYSIPCSTTASANGICQVNGIDVLGSTTGLSTFDGWENYGILVALLIAFRIITILILTFKPQRYIQKLQVRQAVKSQSSLDGEASDVNRNNMDDKTVPSDSHTVIEVDSNDRSNSDDQNRKRENDINILEWQDVELQLRSNQKVLVSGMSGFSVSGQLLAILGGSGAGKTTFLNALAYRATYAHITGRVTLNGRPLRRTDLVYVPQFDTLNSRMSCYESLVYTAELYGESRSNGSSRSEHLLNLLDLSHRSSASVSTLTFGERKRLAVAMGLLSSAPILVLDEPTTGLDAYNAQILVNYVAKLVQSTNVICLMTVHQPGTQLLATFDTMMLLTRGTTAYFGPAKHAKKYFSNLGLHIPAGTNPSDFYLDCITQKPADLASNMSGKESVNKVLLESNDWFDIYQQHSVDIPQLKPSSSTPLQDIRIHYSEIRRFGILVRYNFMYFIRERSLYLLRGLSLIILALFIGSLYFQLSTTMSEVETIAGFVFFSTWATLFAAISGIVVHARDRLTTENEYLNGAYKLTTALLATLIASIPYHFVTGLVYNAIMWFMVGVNNTGVAYIHASLMTAVLLLMMESVALIVVAELKDAMLSTTFSMVMLGTFYLFAGFFVQQNVMIRPIFWACYLVPTKYSLDGQLDNIMVSQSYSQSINGRSVLSQFFLLNNSLETSPWGNWGIVIAFAAGFRLLHWMLLTIQYRKYHHN